MTLQLSLMLLDWFVRESLSPILPFSFSLLSGVGVQAPLLHPQQQQKLLHLSFLPPLA